MVLTPAVFPRAVMNRSIDFFFSTRSSQLPFLSMNQALKSNVIVPGILPVVMLPDLNDLLSDAHDLGSFNPRTKNFQAGGLLQVVSVVDFKSQ